MIQQILAPIGLLLFIALPSAAKPPNILLILADDHAKNALGCYGNTDIKTPALDRIAAEGMRFNHALTPNSFCTPARASVLTGKYSHKNGVTHLNQSFDGSQQTFPKLLQQAGYETSLFGKWHLLSQPTGFDFYCVQKMQGMPYDTIVHETGMKWIPWSPQDRKSYRKGGRVLKGYNNDTITTQALTWLKQTRDPGKPFCLCLHPKPPHQPYAPPKKYEDFLKDVTIPEPPTLLDDYKGRTPEAIQNLMTPNRIVLAPAFKNHRAKLEKANPKITRNELTRMMYQEYIKGYYRLVKSVDDNVGRMLDYLDKSGLADNTLVIYTSDQGFSLGEHGFYNKQWMYESPLHQPLLVRLPDAIKPGTVHESMVNHVDLAPTILDYAGVTVPGDMQGYSLKPILAGKTRKVRDTSYYHFYEHGKRLPEMLGVRTATHKLIHYPGMNGKYQWEMFDLQNDPEEMDNLYAIPKHRTIREHLKETLRSKIKQLGDPVDAPAFQTATTVSRDEDQAADMQPNIVHILVDDLGWQDVACYRRDYTDDEPLYETPNMDRIAARGIRFMQAYSPSVTCAPSRAAFLTGQYTPHNGVYHVNMGCQIPRPRRTNAQMLDPYYVGRLMPGKPVIGNALKQAGYRTAHVGKWHVAGASGYPSPIQVGFDFSFDHNKEYNDPEIYDKNDPKIANFPGLFNQPKNRLKDAFNDPRFPLLEDDRPYDSMTDLSQRWIRKVARGDQPFFLNLCPNLVHGPVMTRDRKRLAYYCKKLGIPFPTDQGSISDPNKPGQHNPYYASAVDSVDWIIGQIVQTLENTNDPRNPGHKLIDNTYMFVSSDNGAAQKLRNWRSDDGKLDFEKVSDNDPLREGKSWAYEGGCRIPFLAMGPNIKPGTVNGQTPVNLIDLFPTFLAIAGQSDHGKRDLDGCNLLPVLQGKDATARFTDGEGRDTIYFHYPVLNGAFSTIRRGPWKLMKNTGSPMNSAPKVQLFQIYSHDGSNLDLGETQNVGNKYPDIKKQMLTDLDRWLSDHNAGVPYRNAAYKPGGLPGQKNIPTVTQRGSEGDQLWATVETGKGKSKIVEAFLLYTTNPGKTEEWFRAPATVKNGRATAKALPGMTHAVFCLIDENNFLIHSEAVPGMMQYRLGQPISAVLEDGYAFRPGLVSLIEVARTAAKQLEKTGQSSKTILSALRFAETTLTKPVNSSGYTKAIHDLRKAVQSLDVPAARHPAMNWFPNP